ALSLTAPMELEANQQLLGEGVGLSLPIGINGDAAPTVLVAAGTAPVLSIGAQDLIRATEAMPAAIRGLRLESGGNVIDLTADAPLSGSPTLTIADNVVGTANGGIDVNFAAATTGQLALAITDNGWDGTGTHTGNAIG